MKKNILFILLGIAIGIIGTAIIMHHEEKINKPIEFVIQDSSLEIVPMQEIQIDTNAGKCTQ